MDRKAKDLARKYNEGVITPEEYSTLEQFIANGEIRLEELTPINTLKSMYDGQEEPSPSEAMTAAFYQKLGEAKGRQNKSAFATWWSTIWAVQPGFQWAYSLVILLAGVIGGYFIKPGNHVQEISKLSNEVTQMKEMMMLTLLEKESTSDRLRAVNLTSELPNVSMKVTEALFKTLNTDENVNVRLATIDALYPYAGHPEVRKGLIEAIDKQDSPLVQVALAEMMVDLQEKRSVKALEELMNKESTPFEVKERIKESIEVLI